MAVAIGTDINSQWSFNDDGDLELISSEDNLSQSIGNRLGTNLNSLNYFYEEYGSILPMLLGWTANETTLEFMKIEISNRLLQDPRIRDFSVDVSYTSNGAVEIDIVVKIGDEDYGTSLVLSDDGVEVNGD